MFNVLLIFLIFNSVVSCSQSEETSAFNVSIPSNEAVEMNVARRSAQKHPTRLKASNINATRFYHHDYLSDQEEKHEAVQRELFEASVLVMQQARTGKKSS